MSHKFRDITKEELNYFSRHYPKIIGCRLQYQICDKCLLLVHGTNWVSNIHADKLGLHRRIDEVNCDTFKRTMLNDIIREIIE